ncbi:MAG: hypothetical protein M3R24_29585 [Chloroflexota bacterium]|nr:hypothetical protein [Chloroflexota bacterium]PLS78955.1 MAG: hypothetical protein CYG59_15845 [Chloroflexota bacterium]
MSDASNHENTGATNPRFDHLDNMERVYAPEQVPNNAIPEHEVDADKGTDASTGAGDAGPLGGGTSDATRGNS